jgi:hypothetical protein
MWDEPFGIVDDQDSTRLYQPKRLCRTLAAKLPVHEDKIKAAWLELASHSDIGVVPATTIATGWNKTKLYIRYAALREPRVNQRVPLRVMLDAGQPPSACRKPQRRTSAAPFQSHVGIGKPIIQKRARGLREPRVIRRSALVVSNREAVDNIPWRPVAKCAGHWRKC